jgi:tetratricopeptide (TPR) repeat protein
MKGPTPPAHSAPTPSRFGGTARGDFLNWPPGAVFALILALVTLAYFPALSGKMLWDDGGHVTRPDLQSVSGLASIWFEIGATQQYYPVLHSAFWLEHRLWGDATVGYHLVNVLLHASAAFLFGLVLRRLALPGAWLAALFFALHPVCAESVAWISEQKNTLSAVFYLAAAFVYLRFDEERRPPSYVWATLLFLLAILTKTVTATLPAALLVVFWFRRDRLAWRRDVLPLLPWFAAALAMGLVTAHFERQLIGAQGREFDLTLAQRLLLGGRAVWFYLGKLLWPVDLVFIYPRWTLDATALASWAFPVAALAVVGALAWIARRQRGPLAAALLFGGTLFPVLGFFNVFPFLFSFVADHFQYLASLAIFAAAATGALLLSARLPSLARRAAAVLLLAALGTLTWREAGKYRDVFSLYETTLRQNPAAWMAHNNLAIALVDAGRATEAIPHYEAALKLRPAYPEGEYNFGCALMSLGRFADAIPHLEHAARLRPRYAEAYNNLGIALLSSGRAAEGEAQLRKALEIRPRFPEAHLNLGLALTRADRNAEAISHFSAAASARPDYADAELQWGIALTATGQFTEALRHLERAEQLQPQRPEIPAAVGRAQAMAGRADDAIASYRRALELRPNFPEVHFNLALALRQTGRTSEADSHVAEAVRLGWKN